MSQEKGSRSVGKNLMVLAGALLLSALLAEAGARLWLRGRPSANATESKAPPLWVRHPFFGFVSSGVFANNVGFHDPRNFPFQRTGDEIVVGIFGGSVAEQLAFYLQSIPPPTLPSARGRPVVFLNFALGSYKQPQQFAVYSHFVDSLDISLNLDGFNEINANSLQLPVNLPAFTEAMFLANEKVEWLLPVLKLLRRAENRAQNLQSRCDSFSALGCLAATAAFRVAGSAAQKLETKIFSLPPRPIWKLNKPRDVVAEGAENWRTYASLQALLAKAKKKDAIFLLQPNQHVLGAKILTEKESAFIGTDTKATARQRERVTRGYEMIRAGVEKLNREGGRAYDLSLLFAGNKEELFIDDCCHLTRLGNERLFARIAELLDETIRARDQRTARAKD